MTSTYTGFPNVGAEHANASIGGIAAVDPAAGVDRDVGKGAHREADIP